MFKLKKAAMNLTSKFGMLNTHRSLVFAVSEERQVHESVLKLVLDRINAITALLRWAKKEKNTSLKDGISHLYDVNLLWANVEREFAEETKCFGKSLKEILQVESGLEALRKNLKDILEKKDKLESSLSVDGLGKKMQLTKTNSTAREIAKLELEEEEIKCELEVKSLKAEIFKNTTVRSSLLAVMDAHVKLAQKTELVFSTARKIIEAVPELPAHLKHSSSANTDSIGEDHVLQLAKELGMEEKFRMQLNNSKNRLNPDDGERSPRPRMITNWDPELQDFILVSNTAPPTESPPPTPGYRRRSKTTVEPLILRRGCTKARTGIGENVIPNNENDTENDSDDYIEPNNELGSPLLSKLRRSASDSTLNTTLDEDEFSPYSYDYVVNSLAENLYDEPEVKEQRCYRELEAYSPEEEQPCQSTFYCETPDDANSSKEYIYNRVYDHRERNGSKQSYTEPFDSQSNAFYCSPYDAINTDSRNSVQSVGEQTYDPRNSAQSVGEQTYDNLKNVADTSTPKAKPRLKPSITHPLGVSRKPLTSSELKRVSSVKGPRPVPRPKPAKRSDSIKEDVSKEIVFTSGKTKPLATVLNLTQTQLKVSEYSQYENTL